MSPDDSSEPGPGTPHGTAHNVWTISGINAGKLNATAFARIANLIGGSGFDHFIIASGIGVTGKLDGGGGLNILDYSKYISAVTVNLATGAATNIFARAQLAA